jgi:hypothetical protein
VAKAEQGSSSSLTMKARVAFGVIVVVALGSGYVGLWQLVHSGTDYGRSWLDVLYDDMQLFVLSSSPLQGNPTLNPWLQVGRFAAALATVFAVVLAGSALFGAVFRRWRRQHTKGHVIVVGESSTAQEILAKLDQAKTKHLHIQTGEAGALRGAGLAGATTVYACGDDRGDSTVNVATTLAAASGKHRPDLKVYAHVSDPRLALSLRARRLQLSNSNDPFVDFFSADELAARTYLRGEDVNPPTAPHILIAGLGHFGQAVLVEYAWQWRLRSPQRNAKVRATVINDRGTSAIVDEVASRWPIVRQVFTLECHDAAAEKIADVIGDQRPYRAYLCYDNEDTALRSALTATPLWHGSRDSLVVRLNRLARHGQAFHAEDGPQLLDDIGNRLKLVGVARLAGDPKQIGEDLVERLAKVIHEQYLIEQQAKGNELRAWPSLVYWHELTDFLRLTNRTQAGDIGTKLNMIGCKVAPMVDGQETFAYQPGEIERLAEHEHIRWMKERLEHGWKYDPKRDDAKKLHDCLVLWDQLEDKQRDKDRQVIRDLPVVLASAGLRIVRL